MTRPRGQPFARPAHQTQMFRRADNPSGNKADQDAFLRQVEPSVASSVTERMICSGQTLQTNRRVQFFCRSNLEIGFCVPACQSQRLNLTPSARNKKTRRSNLLRVQFQNSRSLNYLRKGRGTSSGSCVAQAEFVGASPCGSVGVTSSVGSK